ncbi:MAG: outer membrane lipoprotein chaperone LolA [Gammaproteobacteria bacterium]
MSFFGHKSALLITLLLTVSQAKANEQARQLINDFLGATASYSAVFDQQLLDENGDILEESSGEFWLQRPGKFRWHYAPPLERLIVSDASKIWLFDPDLDQVTIRSADGALEQTPAGLLVSGTAMLEGYDVDLGESGALQTVLLKPLRGDSEFTLITLALRDNRLRRLVLEDRFGQQTRIEFYDTKLNPSLKDGLFSFDPPEGVDIIDQTGG